jgi:hypothetical protein
MMCCHIRFENRMMKLGRKATTTKMMMTVEEGLIARVIALRTQHGSAKQLLCMDSAIEWHNTHFNKLIFGVFLITFLTIWVPLQSLEYF